MLRFLSQVPIDKACLELGLAQYYRRLVHEQVATDDGYACTLRLGFAEYHLTLFLLAGGHLNTYMAASDILTSWKSAGVQAYTALFTTYLHFFLPLVRPNTHSTAFRGEEARARMDREQKEESERADHFYFRWNALKDKTWESPAERVVKKERAARMKAAQEAGLAVRSDEDRMKLHSVFDPRYPPPRRCTSRD